MGGAVNPPEGYREQRHVVEDLKFSVGDRGDIIRQAGKARGIR